MSEPPNTDEPPDNPAGWYTVINLPGDRTAVSEPFYATGAQAELELAVSGDIQDATACVLKDVTDTPEFSDRCADSLRVTAVPGQPGRGFVNLDADHRYAVGVKFDGAGRFHAWLLEQP